MAQTSPQFRISGSYLAIIGEGKDAVRVTSHHNKEVTLKGKGPIYDELYDTIFVTGHSSYNPIKGGGYYGVDPLCAFEVRECVRMVSRTEKHVLIEEQNPKIEKLYSTTPAEPGTLY